MSRRPLKTMAQELILYKEAALRPPRDLAELNSQWLEIFGRMISKLGILPQRVAEHYFRVAEQDKTTPMAAMLGDLSTMSFVGGRSGVQFVDWLSSGVMSITKQTLLNGGSGAGKSQAIKTEHKRLTALNAHIKKRVTEFDAAQEDDDGDVEVTPFVRIDTMNFDKKANSSVDFKWSRGRFHDKMSRYYAQQHPSSTALVFLIQGERMKAVFKSIIDTGGHGIMHVNELEDKMNSLKEGGSLSVGQMFIALGDSVIPSRFFATAKLSTPEIRNARCVLLAGCTPRTAHELLHKFGLKGVMRRFFLCYLPACQVSVRNVVRRHYDVQGDSDALPRARSVALNNETELETRRLEEVYDFFMLSDDEESLFKSEIPVVEVGLMSPSIAYRERYRDNHPEDEDLDNFVFPDEWTDEQGVVLDELKVQDDVYYEMLEELELLQANSVLSEAQSIVFGERIAKVFSFAFPLTLRERVLHMTSVEQRFEWNLKLSISSLRAARAFLGDGPVRLFADVAAFQAERVHVAGGYAADAENEQQQQQQQWRRRRDEKRKGGQVFEGDHRVQDRSDPAVEHPVLRCSQVEEEARGDRSPHGHRVRAERVRRAVQDGERQQAQVEVVREDHAKEAERGVQRMAR